MENLHKAHQELGWSYLPCHPCSLYHDLECGHRVRTEEHVRCGSNCSYPGSDAPFICAACIELEAQRGLGIENLEEDRSSLTANETLTAKALDSQHAQDEQRILRAVVAEQIEDLRCTRACQEATPVSTIEWLRQYLQNKPHTEPLDQLHDLADLSQLQGVTDLFDALGIQEHSEVARLKGLLETLTLSSRQCKQVENEEPRKVT